MKIKTRIILIADALMYPVTSWLAYRSQLLDIQALIPPRSKQIAIEIHQAAKRLPRAYRGAFLFDIHEQIKRGCPEHWYKTTIDIYVHKWMKIAEREREQNRK